jgi:hypothetical protein
MARPHHQDKCILQDRDRCEPLARTVDPAEYQINVAAIELGRNVEGAAWPQVELDGRRRRRNGRRQGRRQHHRGIVVERQHEAVPGGCRIEGFRFECQLQFVESIADRPRQLLRAGRRHHSVRRANE